MIQRSLFFAAFSPPTTFMGSWGFLVSGVVPCIGEATFDFGFQNIGLVIQ